MDESKKELFKRVYSRQPLTMKFVMVLLAGFAVLVFYGGVLAVILFVFCTKVNRADKEMVDRTIAEMNRGEMEECKLLNP